MILVLANTAAEAQTRAAEPSAADVATARDLFREGAKLANEANWALALDRYQRSMALRPSALTRYSLAVAQERNAKLVEAIENLYLFIREAQDPEARQYVAHAQALLLSIERRVPKLQIEILGNPRGPRVRVDHQDVPEASIGVPRVTNPGVHRVEVSVQGYRPFSQQVSLKEGEMQRLAVRLHPDDDSHDEGEQARASSGHKNVGLGLIVGGGATLVGGLVMGIAGYSQAKNADSREGDQADNARTLAVAGDITMGVGLIAGGIGTFLLLTSPEPSKDPAVNGGVTAWAAPGAAGVSFARVF